MSKKNKVIKLASKNRDRGQSYYVTYNGVEMTRAEREALIRAKNAGAAPADAAKKSVKKGTKVAEPSHSTLFNKLIVLVRWTDSISSKHRINELRQALSEVIETSGEKGLLEMAGVPVDNIYYGDSGVSLFLNDKGSWTYSDDELQNIKLFETCNKAVVHIETQVSGDSSYFDAMPESGTGSGFFISQDGLIVTNYHVIKDATNITVSLHDGSEYAAQLLGSDDENDIAVIRITPDAGADIEILSFGDSSFSVTVRLNTRCSGVLS